MVSLTFNSNLSSWHVAGLAGLLGEEMSQQLATWTHPPSLPHLLLWVLGRSFCPGLAAPPPSSPQCMRASRGLSRSGSGHLNLKTGNTLWPGNPWLWEADLYLTGC